MVRKVSMEEPVRVIRGTLVLMNVQKRRLQERKRQHQVHQYGNNGPHTRYRTTCEFVELRSPACLGQVPRRSYPASLLHAAQCRIQGAFFDAEQFIGSSMKCAAQFRSPAVRPSGTKSLGPISLVFPLQIVLRQLALPPNNLVLPASPIDVCRYVKRMNR
jgi:hypothetical protein